LPCPDRGAIGGDGEPGDFAQAHAGPQPQLCRAAIVAEMPTGPRPAARRASTEAFFARQQQARGLELRAAQHAQAGFFEGCARASQQAGGARLQAAGDIAPPCVQPQPVRGRPGSSSMAAANQTPRRAEIELVKPASMCTLHGR
jgi:hypothetical protein